MRKWTQSAGQKTIGKPFPVPVSPIDWGFDQQALSLTASRRSILSFKTKPNNGTEPHR